MKQLLLATLVVLAPGCFAADDRSQTLGTPGGRYVYGQVSSYHSDQFMLDTQTGRIWRIACYDDPPTPTGVCHDQRLQPMKYVGPAFDTLWPEPLALRPMEFPMSPAQPTKTK